MNFQSELSGLLKERISRYYQDLNVEEVGTVLSIGDGIVRVYGLQNIQAGKMVEFSSGVKGYTSDVLHRSFCSQGLGYTSTKLEIVDTGLFEISFFLGNALLYYYDLESRVEDACRIIPVKLCFSHSDWAGTDIRFSKPDFKYVEGWEKSVIASKTYWSSDGVFGLWFCGNCHYQFEISGDLYKAFAGMRMENSKCTCRRSIYCEGYFIEVSYYESIWDALLLKYSNRVKKDTAGPYQIISWNGVCLTEFFYLEMSRREMRDFFSVDKVLDSQMENSFRYLVSYKVGDTVRTQEIRDFMFQELRRFTGKNSKK